MFSLFFRNMRFPPDEWSIRLDDLFESTVGDDSTSKLSAEVLVQTDNTARISSCFRILLSGVDTIKLDIPAENILIMGGGSRLQDQDGDEAPGHHPEDQCDHLRVVRSDGKVINKYKGQKTPSSPIFLTAVYLLS